MNNVITWFPIFNYGIFNQFVLFGFVLLLFSSGSSAGELRLAWDESRSANVGGYKLYYGQTSKNYTSAIDVGKVTEYSVTGLPVGKDYFFALKSYNTAKSIESSSYSNEVRAKIPAGIVKPLQAATFIQDKAANNNIATKKPLPRANVAESLPSMLTSLNSDGLIAAYDFEEFDGNSVYDSSGYGNHGVIRGALRVIDGRYGRAMKFDGLNDWITVKNNDSLYLSRAFTLEAWIKPFSVRKGTVIAKDRYNGTVYDLYAFEDRGLPSSSFVNNRLSHNVISGKRKLPIGKWVHITSTFDGRWQKLYIDGVQVSASWAGNGLPRRSVRELRIGGNRFSGDFFQGCIDDVRIYNRALSRDEIIKDLNIPVFAK